MLLIGADHRGFALKAYLIKTLSTQCTDIGCHSDKRCDFNDVVKIMAESLNTFGVLICQTGLGMSICANRYKHIRAALCLNLDMTKLSREHLDANILIMPAKYIENNLALEMVKTFINTAPLGDPAYKIRLKKLMEGS